MKNYDELIAMLSQGASISRERNLNLDFAKVADAAANAIQELQAELSQTKILHLAASETVNDLWVQRDELRDELDRCKLHVKHIGNDALRTENEALQNRIDDLTSDRDEYRKAADTQAAAHKVERDELEKSLKDASVAAIAEALEVDNLRHELSVLKEKHCYTKADLEQQEPVAWLKTWNSVGNAQEGMRRVDLTPESELWLANMFPKVTPLFLAAGAAPQGEQQ
jgi:DNA repair exonuclease SbcCD ATPase subunit